MDGLMYVLAVSVMFGLMMGGFIIRSISGFITPQPAPAPKAPNIGDIPSKDLRKTK